MAGKAGLARSQTDGTYKPLLSVKAEDPMEAVALYLDVEGERLLFLSVDYGQFSRGFSSQVREGIAKRLGLPVESIVFHSTHNHSGPTEEDYVCHQFPLEPLIGCLAAVGQAAREAAVPARVALATANVGNRYSLCRRKWLDDDVATLCCWYGYRDEGARGQSANHLIRERLRRWFGPDYADPDWLQVPIYYDDAVDPLVQILAFDDLRGNALGGLIRFAAHPHLMNGAEQNAYATDYCGPARRWLDRMRGGVHLFAEGPQCNLAPRETVPYFHQPGRLNWADTPYGPDGSLVADTAAVTQSVRDLGEALAGHALDALQHAEFRPLEILRVETAWHDLPMAADVPDNSAIGWQIRDQLGVQVQQARREGAPLIVMKRLTDQYNRFHWMQKMLDEWYRPTPDEILAKRLPVHLQAICINDAWLAGLPAETGRDTTLWLRANTVGERLITVQQCNGDIGYILPPQDRRGGCYESMCSLIADDGETAVREGALALLQRVM
jgi:hypothetical protein